MEETARLTLARKVLVSGIHYTGEFETAPLMEAEDGLGLLRPADVVVHYAPQVSLKHIDKFDHFVWKGMLHASAIVQTLSGDMHRIEIPQKLFSGSRMLKNYDKDTHARLYTIVLRSPEVEQSPTLMSAINRELIHIAGYDDRSGPLELARHIRMNQFFKGQKGRSFLFCAEYPYLAYKKHGIELCGYHSAQQLMDEASRYLEASKYKTMWGLSRRYAKGVPLLRYFYLLLMGTEDLGATLNISVLRPSSHFWKKVILPYHLSESTALKIVLIVPPSKACVENYLRLISG